jgi:acetyl-CoA carboxylase biotin carboxyl carrier protein
MKISKQELDFIAHSLKEHDLSFIEYKDQEFSIKVGSKSAGNENSDFLTNDVMNVSEKNVNKASEVKKEVKVENLQEIRIPIVGNLYFTKSPAEPQFVKVGDYVNVGDVIAIVEAMKVMNEVKADCAGTLVEICVENGTFVDANTVIMKLK